MKIPFSYNLKNLWTRRLTTSLTIGGMALVVFVFSAVLMLAEGLKKTLVATGSPDNVVVIRKGSDSEIQSGVERIQASTIELNPKFQWVKMEYLWLPRNLSSSSSFQNEERTRDRM